MDISDMENEPQTQVVFEPIATAEEEFEIADEDAKKAAMLAASYLRRTHEGAPALVAVVWFEEDDPDSLLYKAHQFSTDNIGDPFVSRQIIEMMAKTIIGITDIDLNEVNDGE